MGYDPNEPYREARRATEVQALARSAEAKSRAAVANTRCDVVTCSGCKAGEQGGNWGQSNCQKMRGEGACQRQVYADLVLARLLVFLVHGLAELGMSPGEIGETLSYAQSQLPRFSPPVLPP